MNSSSDSLRKRVQYVVDTAFGGSANAAAKHSGVPQQSLSRILRGTTVNPRMITLARLANGVGIGVGWLAFGVGRKPMLKRRCRSCGHFMATAS